MVGHEGLCSIWGPLSMMNSHHLAPIIHIAKFSFLFCEVFFSFRFGDDVGKAIIIEIKTKKVCYHMNHIMIIIRMIHHL